MDRAFVVYSTLLTASLIIVSGAFDTGRHVELMRRCRRCRRPFYFLYRSIFFWMHCYDVDTS